MNVYQNHTTPFAINGDALSLLADEHESLKSLFAEYQHMAAGTGSKDQRQELAQQICQKFTVHSRVEVEIFYPEVRDAIEDSDFIDEMIAEHDEANDMVSELELMEPSEEGYDDKVDMLSEIFRYHLKAEEEQVFAMAKNSSLDLVELGRRMAERREEYIAELEPGVEGVMEKSQ
jgi:uncharacterized protein (DUF305 family)